MDTRLIGDPVIISGKPINAQECNRDEYLFEDKFGRKQIFLKLKECAVLRLKNIEPAAIECKNARNVVTKSIAT